MLAAERKAPLPKGNGASGAGGLLSQGRVPLTLLSTQGTVGSRAATPDYQVFIAM